MMTAMTTAPWPGPGDSEGPVGPEGWAVSPRDLRLPDRFPIEPDNVPFTVTPWPGPGDSEG